MDDNLNTIMTIDKTGRHWRLHKDALDRLPERGGADAQTVTSEKQ